MPAVRGIGKGVTQLVSLRLDQSTYDHFKALAHKNGTTLSEFLRLTLVRGVAMEAVDTIEQRLTHAVESAGQLKGAVRGGALSEDQLTGLILTELIVTQIAEARDQEALQKMRQLARDKAKRQLSVADATQEGNQ